jgi:SAM-dependent methyltransferase
MHNNDVAHAAAEWLATPPGRYVLDKEQAYFDRTVADIFGYNALQLGLPQAELLKASRIPFRLKADPSATVGLRTDFRDLPIAANSIDLVVLAHVLEFSADPHQVLREVARVLLPEGQLLIAGYNPWSPWGWRRVFGRRSGYPWNGRFINLPRLKDWLRLLELEITGGQMCCYTPPFSTEKALKRFEFADAAGDRWWPIGGGIYFLQAVKRVRGMRLIVPKWSDRLVPKENLAPAPKKVARPEEALVARNSVSHES